MTEALNRDDMIQLLNGLGSERDEDVLEAARQIHARIAAAGVAWEDLLTPDEPGGETEGADDAGGETEGADDADREEPADETPEPSAETAATNAESLDLIEGLLARSDISADLREELEGYKTDIAEGDFDQGDRRYLRAMAERLSKRR